MIPSPTAFAGHSPFISMGDTDPPSKKSLLFTENSDPPFGENMRSSNAGVLTMRPSTLVPFQSQSYVDVSGLGSSNPYNETEPPVLKSRRYTKRTKAPGDENVQPVTSPRRKIPSKKPVTQIPVEHIMAAIEDHKKANPCQSCKRAHEFFIERDKDKIVYGKNLPSASAVRTEIQRSASGRATDVYLMICTGCEVKMCLSCIEDDNFLHPVSGTRDRAGSLKSVEFLKSFEHWKDYNRSKKQRNIQLSQNLDL